MVDFQKHYALWDEFLEAWPVSRLETMTLDEYILVGSQDTFTYWLESRLDKLGSIWGGSAFKFGVFSRKATEFKQSSSKLSYSDTHGWYSALGDTAQEAFTKVRGFVVQVAKWSVRGDLDAIEDFNGLGEVYKWKIAFHYQNRSHPAIVCVFKRKMLANYLGLDARQRMASLQRAVIASKPASVGILEYAPPIWAAGSDTGMTQTANGGRHMPHVVSSNSQTRADCLNRIYYGPPGTGKTWHLMQLLKRDYETRADEVSIEQWQAQMLADHFAGLKWWEGVAAALYQLGGQARVPELVAHPFVQAIVQGKGRTGGINATLWGTLQHHTVLDSATVNIKLRLGPAIFDKSADSIWQFAGDWQETCAELVSLVDRYQKGPEVRQAQQRYSFVTFHQSYGYEEFVEGLRPVLGSDEEAGVVEYEIRAGVFKELCLRARQNPGQRYAMVIDEINRGNISKIFGELITLIEPDKREGATNAVSVILPYSREKFSVPANVDIIGTMNTADRSLALLDTALRRRFDFEPLLPDTRNLPDAPLAGLMVNTGQDDIDVRRILEHINQRIAALYDADHCIGHAYFTRLRDVEDGPERFALLARIFRQRILPLLEEYFFEDWHKIQLVLGDNQKPAAARFVIKQGDHEQGLSFLFGDNHGLDSYSVRRRYQLQPAAFTNPAAYLGIYQPLA